MGRDTSRKFVRLERRVGDGEKLLNTSDATCDTHTQRRDDAVCADAGADAE